IRYFDNKPVTKDDVLKLLDVAHLAPSVENLQPWRFDVIFDKKLRKELMEACCYGNFVEGAGVFIVVSANKTMSNAGREPVWNAKELEYSCMAAMMNLLHGATAMGLGSCWVSLHHGKAHEILNLPMHDIVVGGVMIGHYRPGEEYPSGEHQRKPVMDCCQFHEEAGPTR
ncbi:MAG TPA: nitroreductase family protein, partial [Candidatus Peribacteria bacterium]|nr:nitroreductase family protein [Candidatus Peribacteria bacterium]